MQIIPLPGSSVDSQFEKFVENAFKQVQIRKCHDAECVKCNSDSPTVTEYAHFSRDVIMEWESNGPGNQFCWSQILADKEKDIDLITEQPCRKYKLLCLVKIVDCHKNIVRKEKGKSTTHFGFTFALSKNQLVKIKIKFDKVQNRYICEGIL